jgi:hypothetical protein
VFYMTSALAFLALATIKVYHFLSILAQSWSTIVAQSGSGSTKSLNPDPQQNFKKKKQFFVM